MKIMTRNEDILTDKWESIEEIQARAKKNPEKLMEIIKDLFKSKKINLKHDNGSNIKYRLEAWN